MKYKQRKERAEKQLLLMMRILLAKTETGKTLEKEDLDVLVYFVRKMEIAGELPKNISVWKAVMNLL